MQSHNSQTILDYYGKTRTGFLHARGKGATNTLLSHILQDKNLTIAEIGFGTGSTLVQIAICKNMNLSGVEISKTMLNTAQKRLKFSLLSPRIKLHLLDTNLQLPYLNESMDMVYAESVLGILGDDALANMFSEIHRVLKPGGKLLLNETIWLDSIPAEEIKKINQLSLAAYGIIQASETCLYPDDWKRLLHKYGLHVVKMEQIKNTSSKYKLNIHLLLSDIFSLIGKIKSKLNPVLRREEKQYTGKMKEMQLTKKVMEGYLIIADK